jgi:tetratricopeptide (TPR) repeat protein
VPLAGRRVLVALVCIAAVGDARANPDDPRALVELGWQQLKAGDLTAARATTLRAIAAAPDNNLKAAALYNLGRIQEQSNQPVDAAQSYRRSLDLRPNKTVQARLATLESPFTAPAIGPFPSVEAYCARKRKESSLKAECLVGDAAVDKGTALVARPGAPITDAKLVLYGSKVEGGALSIALKTAGGWFVAPLSEDAANLEVESLQLDASGVLQLRAIAQWNAADNPDGRWSRQCSQTAIVCGAAAKPWCTHALSLAQADCDGYSSDSGKAPDWSWRVVLQVSGRKLTLSRQSGDVPSPASTQLGSHDLPPQ